MNVNNIHNTSFADNLPPTFLAQTRALANWHEYNIFTAVDPSGVGNSAFVPLAVAVTVMILMCFSRWANTVPGAS